MSETDPVVEVEELEPEYPGDPGEPEEETPETDDEEGIVEEQAEEASEESEETGEESPPSEDDGALDLSTFPEELRETARKYGDQRIAGIQSSWQEKIEAATAKADDLKGAKDALDAYNQALREKPVEFIQGLIRHADEQGLLPNEDEGPADPGEPPDPMETAAFNQWIVARDARRDWQTQRKLDERDKKHEQELAPVQQLLQQVNLTKQIKADQTTLGADDVEMGEIVKLHQGAASDRVFALKLIQEVVRLRKQVDTKAKAVETAKAGTEEKSGLSRTKERRARPKSTGDPMTDVLAEMEHDGIKIPDDL